MFRGRTAISHYLFMLGLRLALLKLVCLCLSSNLGTTYAWQEPLGHTIQQDAHILTGWFCSGFMSITTSDFSASHTPTPTDTSPTTSVQSDDTTQS